MQSARNMIASELYLKMPGSMFVVPSDQIQSLTREIMRWEKKLKALPQGLCSSPCISSKHIIQDQRSLFSKEEPDNSEKVNRLWKTTIYETRVLLMAQRGWSLLCLFTSSQDNYLCLELRELISLALLTGEPSVKCWRMGGWRSSLNYLPVHHLLYSSVRQFSFFDSLTFLFK